MHHQDNCLDNFPDCQDNSQLAAHEHYITHITYYIVLTWLNNPDFFLQFWYQISNILHTVALKKRRLCSSSCPVFIYPVLNSLEYGNVSRGEPRYSALQNNNSMQPAIFSGDKGIQNHYKFISHDLHMLHYLFLIRGVYNFISFGFFYLNGAMAFTGPHSPPRGCDKSQPICAASVCTWACIVCKISC